jgi:hypothetical protein
MVGTPEALLVVIDDKSLYRSKSLFLANKKRKVAITPGFNS